MRGAFSADRVAVLEVLAAQAALSLENARVYEALHRFLVKPMESADFLGIITEVIGEYKVEMLSIPERPLAEREVLERMHVEVLSRKLKKKVAELEEERDALRMLSETLEQRIAQAVDELRRKDELLLIQGRQALMGEMIGNIAHQWRQPLNMLGLLVQELSMTHNKGEFGTAYHEATVKKMLATIYHMYKTIDDFRHFFRPSREKAAFRILEMVEKTLALLEGSLDAQRIKTEVVAACDPVINGYPDEFSQVLLNVMINARDAFLTQKEVTGPRITIEIGTEKGSCIVTITDNAGGIPEGIIDKIFDPYFTTKGPGKGTRVGLFMSKMIIEKNMGGTLSARNVEGGAQFRIEV